MSAGRLHLQLLEQAHHLATREPTRPRQASLRRSVSAAYYGLFHFLIHEATGLLFQRQHAARTLRELLSRTFQHRAMAGASKAFDGDVLPRKLGSVAGRGTSPELRSVAQAFLALQQARHTADYDLSARFLREDVLGLVQRAERAVLSWHRIRSTPEARFYLISLLAWDRLKAR